MVYFGITYFLLFVIDVSSNTFKATIFIHAAFIYTLKGFTIIYIEKHRKISSKFHFWHIFLFHPVADIFSGSIFLLKNMQILLSGTHILLFLILILYIDGKPSTMQTLWRIIRCHRLKNVKVIAILLNQLCINILISTKMYDTNRPWDASVSRWTSIPNSINLYFSESAWCLKHLMC